jgi:predicted SAM-dependent methyltransferase
MAKQQNKKAQTMQAYKQTLKRVKPFSLPDTDKKIVLAMGWASAGAGKAYQHFKPEFWQEVRVDADATMDADVMAHPYAASSVPDACVDAVFIGHVLHRYSFHDARATLKEALRVVKDAGQVVIAVPDMQLAATYVANDEMEAAVYHAPVGAITAIDMLFGFQKTIGLGDTPRQHRSGYTLTSLGTMMRESGLSNIKLHRQAYDLFAIGVKLPYGHPERVDRITMQTEAAERPKAPAIQPVAGAQAPTAVRFADPLEGEPQRWTPLGLKK